MPTYETLPRFTTDLDRLTPEQRRRFRQTVAAFVEDLRTGRFRAGLCEVRGFVESRSSNAWNPSAGESSDGSVVRVPEAGGPPPGARAHGLGTAAPVGTGAAHQADLITASSGLITLYPPQGNPRCASPSIAQVAHFSAPGGSPSFAALR